MDHRFCQPLFAKIIRHFSGTLIYNAFKLLPLTSPDGTPPASWRVSVTFSIPAKPIKQISKQKNGVLLTHAADGSAVVEEAGKSPGRKIHVGHNKCVQTINQAMLLRVQLFLSDNSLSVNFPSGCPFSPAAAFRNIACVPSLLCHLKTPAFLSVSILTYIKSQIDTPPKVTLLHFTPHFFPPASPKTKCWL